MPLMIQSLRVGRSLIQTYSGGGGAEGPYLPFVCPFLQELWGHWPSSLGQKTASTRCLTHHSELNVLCENTNGIGRIESLEKVPRWKGFKVPKSVRQNCNTFVASTVNPGGSEA